MEKTQISVQKTKIPRRCQKNLDLVKKPRSRHTSDSDAAISHTNFNVNKLCVMMSNNVV